MLCSIVGRGKHKGPKELRFRALLACQAHAVDEIEDMRQAGKVKYPLRDCYRSGFALFYLQDPSVLELQRRLHEQIQANNLSTVFEVEAIPADSQLRDVIDTHEYLPLLDVYRQYFVRMQRSKKLERYQYYKGHYLLTIDGSQYFSSDKIHCDLCLSSPKSDGVMRYYHQILQPAVVHPDFREVIPLAPEFIRRQDGRSKQDCETNAGKRAIQRIRSEHRQLPLIIVCDSLYAAAPFVRLLK